jgi:DNA-binding NarL/FixJ family response regulator
MTIRIAAIEDDARYRSSLETLFHHAPGFAWAGAYGSAEAALLAGAAVAAREEPPPWDLLLMDLDLPDMGGVEATRQFKRMVPTVAIVVLTVFEDVDSILRAICAGADGYLLKRAPVNELLRQLEAIVNGGAPLTAGVARTILDLVRTDPPMLRELSRGPAAPALTDREREVLQGLVAGRSYKQVADHLAVSLDTVRSHIRSIYRKLQVHSVAEAVGRALRERLI